MRRRENRPARNRGPELLYEKYQCPLGHIGCVLDVADQNGGSRTHPTLLHGFNEYTYNIVLVLHIQLRSE
jgi:hypothetical protein